MGKSVLPTLDLKKTTEQLEKDQPEMQTVKPAEQTPVVELPANVEASIANVEWVTVRLPIYTGSDMSPVRQSDKNFNCGHGSRETGIVMKRIREALARIDAASNINQRRTLFYVLEEIAKQANLS